jgi:hypothetical protein
LDDDTVLTEESQAEGAEDKPRFYGPKQKPRTRRAGTRGQRGKGIPPRPRATRNQWDWWSQGSPSEPGDWWSHDRRSASREPQHAPQSFGPKDTEARGSTWPAPSGSAAQDNPARTQTYGKGRRTHQGSPIEITGVCVVEGHDAKKQAWIVRLISTLQRKDRNCRTYRPLSAR